VGTIVPRVCVTTEPRVCAAPPPGASFPEKREVKPRVEPKRSGRGRRSAQPGVGVGALVLLCTGHGPLGANPGLCLLRCPLARAKRLRSDSFRYVFAQADGPPG